MNTRTIEALDPGINDVEYNKGWRLAEDHLRAGLPSNGVVPEEVTTSNAFEGYVDRMGIHTFNEMEAAS